jgi:hypothetical protein
VLLAIQMVALSLDDQHRIIAGQKEILHAPVSSQQADHLQVGQNLKLSLHLLAVESERCNECGSWWEV